MGTWHTGSTEFTFLSNGDFYIKSKGEEIRWTKWKLIDSKLYIGFGDNNEMIRVYFEKHTYSYFSYSNKIGGPFDAAIKN